MNTFCYNCNGVEMVGDTYSLNTTLCWVLFCFYPRHCQIHIYIYTSMAPTIRLEAYMFLSIHIKQFFFQFILQASWLCLIDGPTIPDVTSLNWWCSSWCLKEVAKMINWAGSKRWKSEGEAKRALEGTILSEVVIWWVICSAIRRHYYPLYLWYIKPNLMKHRHSTQTSQRWKLDIGHGVWSIQLNFQWFPIS